jgi:uncharacterized protein (TIGR03437 family)
MKRTWTLLFLSSLVIGTSSAQVTTYNTRSSWLAATSHVTTIDFTTAAPPPSGLYTEYPAGFPLALSGVNFSSTSAGAELIVISQTYCCPTYARGYDQLSSGAGIQVTLPAGTTAFGFDLFTVVPGNVNGTNQDLVDVVVGQKYVVTTAVAPNTVFIGFVSASPIASLTIIPEQVHGPTQVDVMNFSFNTGIGSTPTSTTLQSSANPSVYGQALTLSATVSPAAATGKVTFYDGVSVLGSATILNGRAAFTTTLLASAVRSLKAYYNGDPVYRTSASAPFAQTVVALGQNGFLPAVKYPVPGFVSSVAVGDFNGDGRVDLASVSLDTNKVSIFLGNGNGTFAAPVDYATDRTFSGPIVVLVGDFNGDGRADLAVLHSATAASTVSVLLGNGDGTFQTAITYPTGKSPAAMVVGDFNGDGIADIATANFDNTVSILLGNGNGTFGAPASSAVVNPNSIATGDFNGDGIADLVVVNFKLATVSVLLGNGNGTFQAFSYPSGTDSTAVAVGDFNGDGRLDLAVLNGSNVGILLGNGNGTFKTEVNYPAGGALQYIAVGDFNGDGRTDLVVTDSGKNSVNVLLGNGNGSFQPPVSYGVGTQAVWVAIGDFNGDGRADLAVANFNNPGAVSVLLGVPGPSVGPHVSAGGVVGAGLSTPPVKALSPNAIASVFGDTFAPVGTVRPVVSADLVNGRLPTVVNNVCVYVNNVPAPIFFLSSNQINFQVPQVPTGGTVGVQVAIFCATPNEIRSPTETVAAAAATPEFFYFKQSADGKNPIAAVNAINGNYIGPAGLIPGANFVPAVPGDFLALFFTGGGATNPAFAAGELPGMAGQTTGSAGISIGATPLAASNIQYAGVAPGFAGLYQLNIQIPAATQPGNQPVILTIGGSASPAGYLFIGPGN